MKPQYQKLISMGALIALSGYILSGPVAFLIVQLVKPQPAWVSSAVFAENYSLVQDLPYYFGFLLIAGMLMLVAGHYLDSKDAGVKIKFRLLIALGVAIVFCTLIAFNYICQTTFVRNLALFYKPEHDAAIAMFSMTNPLSFCWANEMWGYAFLGIATWLMAAYYREKNNFICGLLTTNGIVSIASAALTIADVNWLLTTAGLIGYFAWNVLMIVMMIMIWLQSKKTV